MPRSPCYSPRLDDALGFVAEAFRHKRRKGSDVPYISHLFAVCGLVAEHGGDEECMIAALLHDYLEDIEGASMEVLEQRFGPRVATWVLALSDSTGHPKPPWRDRKLAYVASLRLAASEVRLISAADKLHNAGTLVRDLESLGNEVWERFNAGRDESLWFYRTVLEALEDGWTHPITTELGQVVARLEALAAFESSAP